MNVKIDRLRRDTCIFQADDVDIDYLHSENIQKKEVVRLRGSVMLAGPMLARFRKALYSKTQVVIRSTTQKTGHSHYKF